MNRNTAIANGLVKREMEKHNSTIVSYLNTNYGQSGKTYLYKAVYKNFLPLNSTTVCFIRLPLDKIMNRFIKRTTDIFLALIVITTILWWLIPLMSVLIKIGSRGPVFFIQKRNKQNGAIFNCIKFRSMTINPLADILPAAENDERITVIGRIIRKTFIDELPQFFNVLWGDMSVIGPRPHMLSESLRFEEQLSYYRYREKIKPGITGLSQILGLEGAADSKQKTELT